MQGLVAYSLLLILYVTGLVKSLCYIDSNCAWSTIPAIDQADCCIGTNDGRAYLDDAGNCAKCVGKFFYNNQLPRAYIISDLFSSSWIC